MKWEIFHNVFEFKFICLIIIFVIKEQLTHGKIKYKKVFFYSVLCYISITYIKLGKNDVTNHFENLILIMSLF